MTRVVIDPVAGIEGHLRIETQVEGSEVVDAWSESSRFQGIELLLRGKDPRDAWSLAQRICGGCARSHALCSVRAVENALRIPIPENARLVRNILTAIQHVQDHVVHFYHHHALDWIDLVGALDADPGHAARLAQSISDWPLSSPDYFGAVQDRVATFFRSKWMGMLDRGYRGHPAYRLPPEANLVVAAHYLQALDWQRDVSRIQGLCGNPAPHLKTYRVGGMACPMDPDNPAALNEGQLAQTGHLFANARGFIERVYLRDLLMVASFYEDWTGYGGGPGNYMVYGDFPLAAADARGEAANCFLPGGLIFDRDLKRVQPLDRDALARTIAGSWTEAGDGSAQGRSGGWLRAPRYNGIPVEVGPLARMLVAYASGHPQVRFWIDRVLAELKLGPEALFSTLGRMTARGIEAVVLAEKVNGWLSELATNLREGNLRLRNPLSDAFQSQAVTGFGWAEAPHGALCHRVHVEAGVIVHYQCLVPSAWNTSPRDASGRRGPCEAALLFTPVPDPERPVEILRTIHSFDPCTAWAVHMNEPHRRRIGLVREAALQRTIPHSGEQTRG